VTSFANKPYDEAYEISQDLSVAESYDGRDKVRYVEGEVWLSVSV